MNLDIEYVISRFPAFARQLLKFSETAPGLSGARVWKVSISSAGGALPFQVADGVMLDLERGQSLSGESSSTEESDSPAKGRPKFQIEPRQSGHFCLRRWPPQHPTEAQLDWIHRVLKGCTRELEVLLPLPLPTDEGATLLRHNGHLWELTPWLAGEPIAPEAISEFQLNDLMLVLARFHHLAARQENKIGHSPNLLARLKQLQAVAQNLGSSRYSGSRAFPLLNAQPTPKAPPTVQHTENLTAMSKLFQQHGATLIERLQLSPIASRGIEQKLGLNQIAPTELKWQWPNKLMLTPIIRDLRLDHVFFQGDHVSGLIDFGAMKIDHRSFDLARLLGSCFDIYRDLNDDGIELAKWQHAVAIYNSMTELPPLSIPEQWLAIWADQVAVVLGSWNWLDWLHHNRIEFANDKLVALRVDFHRRRLDNLINAATL